MVSLEIKKGQLVRSRRGRDKDNYFLVYAWDENFVYVVDGDWRKIQEPKKKNIKHLWYTNKVSPEIEAKLSQGEKVTNADIREALGKLLLEMNYKMVDKEEVT
jgi:ribosomal protein L14E/L6E/L27E